MAIYHKLKWGLLFAGVLLYSQETLSESRQNAITRAIDQVSDAVASINVVQEREFTASPFFQDPWFQHFFPPEVFREKVKGSGSGVVISPDGYVLTNHHVVENALKVVVTLPGGDEYIAEIVGGDKVSDLALLKLEGRNFPYVKMGNSDDLIMGEWVIALGNPFGLFDVSNKPTATAGIISGTDMDFGRHSSGRVFKDMIQTDAAINPGNSGGPLINAHGEIIGINTFIYTGSNSEAGSIGIGFAIPINRARRIAEELKTTGRIERDFSTGLTVQPLDLKTAEYLDTPFRRAVLITKIQNRSAAEKANLSVGDIIVTVEGESVRNAEEILQVISEGDFRPGDKLRLKIWRSGKYIYKALILRNL